MDDSIQKVLSNNTKVWYQNGEYHRIDGPAIEYPDGTKYWYQNGNRHRTDGPAIEYPDGSKEWWVDDQLHRLDGPAYERTDGTKEWFVRDTDITEWIKEQGFSDNPSVEEQVLIRLTWG